MDDGTLSNGYSTQQQRLMNFLHTPILAIAEQPHQCDDVQTELPMRQGPSPFLLGVITAMVLGAGGLLTATQHQRNVVHPLQRGYGTSLVMSDPQRFSAVRASLPIGGQQSLAGRHRTRSSSCHFFSPPEVLFRFLQNTPPVKPGCRRSGKNNL